MDAVDNRVVRFHLDVDVLPADDLKGCVVDFIDLLKDATVDCLSDIQWLASIEKGSVALAAYPTSKTETEEEIDDCLTMLRDNFVMIKNNRKPSDFSEKTLRRYRQLMKNFSCDGEVKGCPTIQVQSPLLASSEPVLLKPFEVMPEKSKEMPSWGSVSGRVKSVSAVKEKYLVLYEEGSGNRVKVMYSSDMIDGVRQSFDNWVVVVGDIYYSDAGIKKKVVAESIELKTGAQETVLFSDLFGILAGGVQ